MTIGPNDERLMAHKGKVCYQINLQLSLGGGEIFTRFLTRALRELKFDTVLFVHADAAFWAKLMPPDTRLVPVRTLAEIDAGIFEGEAAGRDALIITHSTLPPAVAQHFAAKASLTGMLHMPLYERLPEGLRHYHRLFGVSEHVIDSAASRGLENVHLEPLYGVADLFPRTEAGGAVGPIRASGIYDWDRRKFRDRLLGWLEANGLLTLRPTAGVFQRRPGLTLGIVSRITPIKQLPALFAILGPVIARFPAVNLEIFGSGGYASVRDLRRALAPIRQQVRLWGQQDDVAAIYPQLDYVLSGLPEKEALGLNLIESQCCNTPVLAVRAPPFTESVLDGATGFLFTDPRRDAGRDFGELLARLMAGQARPQPKRAVEHLVKFSTAAFRGRVGVALESVPDASAGDAASELG